MEAEGFYSTDEILELERCFLRHYTRLAPRTGDELAVTVFNEDALFIAFEKTLDLLKKIHESKGEIVDDFQFVKRQLVA